MVEEWVGSCSLICRSIRRRIDKEKERTARVCEKSKELTDLLGLRPTGCLQNNVKELNQSGSAEKDDFSIVSQ